MPDIDLAENNDLFIAVCIDESGSMNNVRDDVIGGFNTFKRDQCAQPGRTIMSVTKFCTDHTPLVEDSVTEAENMPDLSRANYVPDGFTALYDAIAHTISAAEKWITENKWNRKVLLVIQTDGGENSSKEFAGEEGRRKVFEMISAKEADGWGVVYLGADQDAMTAGGTIGVSASNRVAYDSHQTAATYSALSTTATSYRGGLTMNAGLGAQIAKNIDQMDEDDNGNA